MTSGVVNGRPIFRPVSQGHRHTIFELIEALGRPDEHDTLGPLLDAGQERIRLWWD